MPTHERAPTVRSRAARLLVALAATLGTPSRPASAQRAAPLPPDSAIQALLAERVSSGRHPGIVVGIVENGRTRVLHQGVAGPGRAPLDGRTLFEIGSITKAFTATLLAEMAERGEVKLDQPVAELLPAGVRVPERGRKITLEDLSTHRSGLPRLPDNLRPATPENPYADYGEPELFAFLASHALAREPGAAYEYSNLGAGLLGLALARRLGTTYERALTERVLAPLGLRDTRIAVAAAERKRLAAGHDAAGDTVPGWDLPTLAGAGALRSTADDMLRFVEANLRAAPATPLGRAMLLARAPRAPVGGELQVGLGWHVRTRPAATIVWHNGGTGGFRSFVGLDAARGRGVVVLVNSSVPADDIGMHLLDPTIPLAPPPMVPTRAAIALDTVALDRVVGTYRFTPQFAIAVTRAGAQLYATPTHQPRFKLFAESPTRFFLRVVDAQLAFEVDSAGRATAVALHQNGFVRRGTREP